MNLDTATRIIQLILAPVVMITSCAIVLGGLLSRFASVNDRMRTMVHERLDLLQPNSGASQEYLTERIQEIDLQMPDLLHRHTLLHNSIFITYLAVAVFLTSMFLIAITASFNVVWLSSVVLAIFLAATTAFFAGVILAIIEVRSSHRAVQYEARRVIGLHLPHQG